MRRNKFRVHVSESDLVDERTGKFRLFLLLQQYQGWVLGWQVPMWLPTGKRGVLMSSDASKEQIRDKACEMIEAARVAKAVRRPSYAITEAECR